MKLGKLIELLGEWNAEANVRLRVADVNDFGVTDGDYLEITDEKNVLMEYGDVVIIGDLPED